MTRKVAFIALALACAALLAPAGAGAAAPEGSIRSSADGQGIRAAALFPALTERTARRVALKLARETAADRNVRWWTLSEAVSQSGRRVVFLYTDRSRDNVFCTAEIVVSQPHRRFRQTRFTGGRCNGVPTEALRIEEAGARFIRAVRGQADAVNSARFEIAEEAAACERLRVPRSRRTDAATLLSAWETQLLTGAVTRDLTIVRDLEQINPQRPEFAGARQHWLQIEQSGFNLYQTLIATGSTEAAESPCRALRRWARNGWTASTAPAFFGDLRAELRRFEAAERGLIRVGRALLALGVSPRAAEAMTPAGVLAVAVPEIRTCSGATRAGCPGTG